MNHLEQIWHLNVYYTLHNMNQLIQNSFEYFQTYTFLVMFFLSHFHQDLHTYSLHHAVIIKQKSLFPRKQNVHWTIYRSGQLKGRHHLHCSTLPDRRRTRHGSVMQFNSYLWPLDHLNYNMHNSIILRIMYKKTQQILVTGEENEHNDSWA